MPTVVLIESINSSPSIRHLGEAGYQTYIDGQVQQVERARVGLIVASFYSQLSRRQHRH